MKVLTSILKFLQKLLAKEFLLIVGFLLIAVPLSLGLLWITARIVPDGTVQLIEEGVISAIELYVLMYVASFLLLYFGRITLGFLKVTFQKEAEGSS